ncbi:MAG: hypothetical protein D6695_10965 [Planctomycetota bacterium]|nr:MAG: hypothetical protein D6695_10965 [Planctomycetota bacterium]
MNPESSKAPSAIEPDEAQVAEDADVADPGKVAEIKARQRETKSGKYGSEKVDPIKPPEDPEQAKELTWIEIELVGEDDKPIPGEKYRVTAPDGRVAEGMLNGEGWARIDCLEPGTCKITFPNLDKDAWEHIESTGPKYPQSQ